MADEWGGGPTASSDEAITRGIVITCIAIALIGWV